MKTSTFKTFLLLGALATTSFAYAQTASILPPAKTQFLDNSGKPLTSGTVDFYIPSTTTRKTTWQNSAETIANANPVVLDAGGRAIILGDGSYRQVVKDRFGNTIWDQVTSSTGSGSSGTTATGDGDLVGTIKPWAGMTAPNQYAFTYGQEVNRTTYATLYTAITSSQPTFCSSGSPILTGLSDTTNFWIGMAVEVTCLAAGNSTIISKTATTVTLAANANVTINVTAIFYPWGRGNGTNTFNLPDFRGIVPAGNNNMGGVASSNLTTTYFGATNPNSAGALGGAESTLFLQAYLPIVNFVVANGQAVSTTSTVATFVKNTGTIVSLNNTGGGTNGLFNDVTAVSMGAVLATGTVTNTGLAASGGAATPFSRVQPTRTSNYIIKITPDTNSATASGVTSLGSMTGDIACGSGLLCTGNTISVGGSQLCYVDGAQYSSIAAAVTACGGKSIIITIDQTLSSVVNVTANHTSLSCTNGANITMGASASIQIKGSDSGISNCKFTGPGVGVASTAPIVLFSGDRNYARNNVVTAFGSTGSSGNVVAIGGNDGEISGNRVYNNVDFGIFVNNITNSATMTKWSMIGNTVDNGILAYASGTSSVLTNVNIGNNIITTGVNSSTMFCVNPQRLDSGASVSNVVVGGNVCKASASGTYGGYSIAGVDGFTVGGNTFNSVYTYTIDAFEIVGSTNGTVNGNTANSGTNGMGFECNDCQNVAFDGNTQNGFKITSDGFAFRASVPDAATLKNVIFSNNNAIFSTAGVGRGFYAYTNNDSAVISGLSFIGNTVKSDETAGSYGVLVDRFSGIITGLQIGPNTIIGPATGVALTSGITTVCLVPGLIASAVPVIDASIPNECGGNVAGALALGTLVTGGTSGRVLYDNAGALGEYTNTQLTALINAATTSLSGAVPAWPNNTTTFFRGDGSYATIPASVIASGAALTKTDDTNVTLTLGGSPTSALLAATSITAGWTGTLANARLATMATNTVKGNATSGTASPDDLAMTSCSAATTSALIWTTNTGFGCRTDFTTNATAAVGQLPGTTTNDSAAAGKIGETADCTANLQSISASSGTAGNVCTLALTAGDWEVYSSAYYLPGAATNVGYVAVYLSTVSATINETIGMFGQISPTTVTGNGSYTSVFSPNTRISLSGSTNYFIVYKAGFTVSTMSVGGGGHARRVR